MGQAKFLVHTNKSLKHQVMYAEAWIEGLSRHGDLGAITEAPDTESEYHMVLGPHYAKKYWLGHPRTILLDRCFWWDDLRYVTLGWMDEEGGRKFQQDCPSDRPKPVPTVHKYGVRALILADYGMDTGELTSMGFDCGLIPITRKHPADCNAPQELLEDVLGYYDIAIGYQTTALISAAIAGLKIVCLDPRNPVYPISNKAFPVQVNDLRHFDRTQWLNNLSYAQWSYEEVKDGTAWEYLKGLL